MNKINYIISIVFLVLFGICLPFDFIFLVIVAAKFDFAGCIAMIMVILTRCIIINECIKEIKKYKYEKERKE